MADIESKSGREPVNLVNSQFYLGEPGKGVIARLTGRIGPGGFAATYCDCSTCACGACSCNCSCNACGACYCDCSCSQMDLVWREDNMLNLAKVMEVLNVKLGEMQKITDIVKMKS